jgi:hypothetical protein
MGNPIRSMLRYVKRAVHLPWRFHEHATSEAEHRAEVREVLHAISGRQTATADLVNAQTHALATHVSNLLWEELPRLVDEHFRRSVTGPVETMTAQFRTSLAAVSAEQQALNDRHAACYDRLVEQLRRQTDMLATLVAAQQELRVQLAELRAHAGHLSAAKPRAA